VTLVRDVSKVLEDLVMSLIPWIPRDPCTASDVLGAVHVILECVKEAFVFILFYFDVIYFQDLVPLFSSPYWAHRPYSLASHGTA
jgi:hypothetical protein